MALKNWEIMDQGDGHINCTQYVVYSVVFIDVVFCHDQQARTKNQQTDIHTDKTGRQAEQTDR